jgi:hypothetical protein
MTALIEVGLWAPMRDAHGKDLWENRDKLPWPGDRIKTDWDPTEKQKLIDHLKAGTKGIIGGPGGANFTPGSGYRGFAGCRLCGKTLGTTDSTDGTYAWPTQLEHYVEVHDVLPDAGLLHHVLEGEESSTAAPPVAEELKAILSGRGGRGRQQR